MDIAKFKKLPVMGILRGIRADIIEPLIETVLSAGLDTIEITMNTAKADQLIKKAVNSGRNRLVIGAGTVLNVDTLKLGLDSGATFIVMPTLVEEVMDYCVSNVIPVFPGAITPTEIYTAWKQGATMVKVFPSRFFGPSYIREMKGPFDKIELMACGGVDSKNVREYFASGASAVAFGSGIFKKELLDKNDFKKIAASIKNIIEEAHNR
jgi:2-dehydro-3-deoxyphosphogluconate aldolase / (4S)-4-hydroxy-2-oxoglutarate aldolase